MSICSYQFNYINILVYANYDKQLSLSAIVHPAKSELISISVLQELSKSLKKVTLVKSTKETIGVLIGKSLHSVVN